MAALTVPLVWPTWMLLLVGSIVAPSNCCWQGRIVAVVAVGSNLVPLVDYFVCTSHAVMRFAGRYIGCLAWKVTMDLLAMAWAEVALV